MPKQDGLVHAECTQVLIEFINHIIEPQGPDVPAAFGAAPGHIQGNHSFEASRLVVQRLNEWPPTPGAMVAAMQ
ncbi:hypothetical protein D3C84_1037780 [compost metagenome]|jgi:hypothetical protein